MARAPAAAAAAAGTAGAAAAAAAHAPLRPIQLVGSRNIVLQSCAKASPQAQLLCRQLRSCSRRCRSAHRLGTAYAFLGPWQGALVRAGSR
jgi:hypothetical protein